MHADGVEKQKNILQNLVGKGSRYKFLNFYSQIGYGYTYSISRVKIFGFENLLETSDRSEILHIIIPVPN